MLALDKLSNCLADICPAVHRLVRTTFSGRDSGNDGLHHRDGDGCQTGMATITAPDAASWTIMENRSAGTGVPAFFRAAVLVGRVADDEEFKSTFGIRARADMASSVHLWVC